ncbi:zf-TFIIB domain-containing protein [Sphingomonas japonica]|uniref:Transcription factor zinc-finger domain-containing protein n=1 Tax=Sphingomonas japonica TaxID=511662 RepID=A0ABX0U225_9SPHN|nr:zf-TFIIB domain-containing protein [Sphingomonas japonica]NIJ23764.1 hypothetical protein [Sphingomonas japonica]
MRTPEAVAGMPCPVCKTGLAMSERNGIEIDYCPTCRGIWLDRGELDKIIERAAAQEAPPAPQPPAPPQPGYAPAAPYPPQAHNPWDRPSHQGQGYDPRYGKKRKKSFLEEMFD